MKNYFKLAVLATAIMSHSQLKAEYLIIYQLDPNGIIMEETAISGEAQLSPSTINRGQSTTLSWNYQYANSVDIKGLGIYGRSGSVTLNPLASRNYEVEVIKGTQKKTENLFLNVIQPNQNIEFLSDKLRVGLGDPVTLNWNVENAEYVDIDNGVGNGLNLVGNSVVYPTLDTTFRLTAKGYEGVEDSNAYITIDVVNDSVINSFNSSAINITTGNSITFNWDVTDSEGVILSPYGNVSGTPTGQQVVDFNTAGFYDFTLRTLSLSGREIVSTPIGINVYNPAVINSYTINGATSTVDVSPNEMMNIDWSTTDALSLKLNGNTVNGTSATLSAPSSVGTINYVLEAANGAGDSVNSSISVNVVSLANIDSFNSPTTVFLNSPFNLSWTGTGVSRYELKSDNSNSGISTTPLDLGSSTSSNVTPTTSGIFTYTLSAYNTANSKFESTKTVIVENLPTFTGFTVNGSTSISVSPNTALTYAGSGFSTGSTLVGRNSSNTTNVTNPATAPATAGTYTYYAAATKTLNSISRHSNVRSVDVTVIDAPTIGTVSSPTTVFSNSAFSMSWSGTNVTNYSIRGNVSASGVSTTDVDLGTTTSRSITPTAAGTYTYTITATNAAGVETTSTRVVTVESEPTFTSFTVNGSTSITVAPNTTLTFAGTGFSTGSSLVGRNSGNTSNAILPTVAPATGGTYTYYAAATKALNSVSKYSTVRAVTVLVQNWVATTPTYTAWVNSGALYGCTWTPDPSTVNSGVSFTQNATNCSQNQTRNRQNREQETTTLAIRNTGAVIVENQTLTNQSNSRSSVGTKINKVCLFDNSNMWSDGYSILNSQMIISNGVVIYFEYNTAINQFYLNGYLYTRGNYVSTTVDNSWGSSVTYYNYYLCAEPI